jgi:hypothetical protein
MLHFDDEPATHTAQLGIRLKHIFLEELADTAWSILLILQVCWIKS